ncbi:MAG: sulfite exporter TauE/SafE family protein [Alphaproteobacteria bacterium]|nr:sulfite exporter TauE/SafE family protein [Alphaproteobacteria bacterium]
MTLLELGPYYWALIALAFVVGGTVKGVIGIGLPLVVVPSIASFTDPVTGVALIAVPVISANIWQIHQAGGLAMAVRRFWSLVLVMMGVIWVASTIFISIDSAVAAGIMGVIVIVFTISRRFPIRGTVPPEAERWASPTVGAVTGLIGGTTGLLSPPLTMYLVALRLPKDEFITAVALLLICAGSPLFINLAAHGILDLEVFAASCIASLPAGAGVLLGTKLRQRISQEFFERALIVALFLIGLNLLRQSFGF